MKKLLSLSFMALLLLTGCTKPMAPNDVKTKIQDFINTQPGATAVVKDVTEGGSVYKITVDPGNGEIVDSYITTDGKLLFPQTLNIEDVQKQQKEAVEKAKKAQVDQLKEVVKKEVPEVELFVMSHCPYGTQIEKGMLPVLNLLGDKIDFSLKFVDYAMHMKKELDEQLTQYCIQKETPDKFISYLTCFLGEGKSADCIAKEELDTEALKSCVAITDERYEVTKSFEDEGKTNWRGQFPPFAVNAEDNEKYGITGSPGFVLNGAKLQTGRDAKSLLSTICGGFITAPEECNQELSSASPTPGFGFGESGAATEASCG